MKKSTSKKTKAPAVRKSDVAEPLTQQQFNHLYMKTQRLVLASRCSMSVAQEIYSLLLIDLVWNANGRDPAAAAAEMRAIGEALAKRIENIPGVSKALNAPAEPTKRVELSDRAKTFLGSGDGYFPNGAPASRSVYFDKKPEPGKPGALRESRPKIIVPAPSNRKH